MKRERKIVLVAHCLLNVNAKVYGIAGDEGGSGLIGELIAKGYGIIQLPCIEMAMFGSNRWGLVYEQTDFPAFRGMCVSLLEPIVEQVADYAKNGYKIAAVIGADLSPSCGVNLTCRGPWGGEFSGDVNDYRGKIASLRNVPGRGVMMEELEKMLSKAGIDPLYLAINESDPQAYREILDAL